MFGLKGFLDLSIFKCCCAPLDLHAELSRCQFTIFDYFHSVVGVEVRIFNSQQPFER